MVTWVDLLDVERLDRVLLVTVCGGDVEVELRRRATRVSVTGPREIRRLGEGGARFDLVCVDGVRLSPEQRRALAALLEPDGRWAQVSDNAVSPLRAWDRRSQGSADRDLHGSLWRLRRQLEREVDVETHQIFALLRSSRRPVMAFDILSRSGMRETFEAGLTHIRGSRGAALKVALRLPPSAVGRWVPGWLVLCGRPSSSPSPRRVVGKVSNNDSDEVKLLRGDPPQELEKRFVVTEPTAEIAALRELGSVGFSFAPELLGFDETSVRYRWAVGNTLSIGRLSDSQLCSWVTRAAEMLCQLQRLTLHDDGTVLVHGDYWLGNLLVSGDRVCCVIDWTRSRRGAPDIDQQFLVDSLAGQRDVSPELAVRLRSAVDHACRHDASRRGGRSSS